MTLSFLIAAVVTLGGAVAAMSLRNLVHCALCLVGAFVGLAVLYLQLNAEFVGLAQVLVYVGAVAILVVFAILLTRSGEGTGGLVSRSWGVGLVVAGLVAGVLVAAVLQTRLPSAATGEAPSAPVQRIGAELMGQYVIPLEVMALLLTAALVGAVIIAMPDRDTRE